MPTLFETGILSAISNFSYLRAIYAQFGPNLIPKKTYYCRTQVVDSGSTMLVLPQDLVERLGLRITDKKVIVTYADERKEERNVAEILTVMVAGRNMECDCVVNPPATEPLLGQIILERLDLLVDSKEGKLVPRPESPYLPMLKMK